MSTQRVNLWQESVTHWQRGRECRRWQAPQEVIATICGRESVWAWESTVGTHCSFSSLLWHWDEKLHRTTRLCGSHTCTNAQRCICIHKKKHTNTHAQTDLAIGSQRAFFKDPAFEPHWHWYCYLTLCYPDHLFHHVPFLPDSLYGWLLRTTNASISDWPDPAVLLDLQ